ncbi:MAG: HslU--HslV peptidase ATPase subunit, partial [Ferrovibrionaceae bacterium]
LERVLEDISFTAADQAGEQVKVDAAYVRKHVGDIARNTDLGKFIL